MQQIGIIKRAMYVHDEFGEGLKLVIHSIYDDGHPFMFVGFIPENKIMNTLDGFINTPYNYDDLKGMPCVIEKFDREDSRFVRLFQV